MSNGFNPSRMSPAERLAELDYILAGGLICMKPQTRSLEKAEGLAVLLRRHVPDLDHGGIIVGVSISVICHDGQKQK
jgi:hypothetical protein